MRGPAGRRASREERGAVAVLMALLAVVLFASGALAVDIATQVNERQELHDTLDAAAHAGTYALPDGDPTTAVTGSAAKNDPEATPTTTLFCVVGSEPVGGTYKVNASHIPSNCYPGAAPYDAARYPGLRCNDEICAIPCATAEGDKCNTARVEDEKPVPFGLARAIGVDHGSTGSLSSAACKGPCGSTAPNPIDFVVVGDRTGSMGGAVADLENAIESLLEFLTPGQHRVALGTIGRSSPTSACPSRPSGSRSAGPWIPVGFSDDFDNTDVNPPSSPAMLNPSSALAKAADCVGNSNSSTGTYLAAPLKAARQLLTGTCVPTACATSASPRPAPVKKAIIFMTDGEPNEDTDPGSGAPYSSNGTAACNNANTESALAKNDGILVVTIAFRLECVRCSGSGSALVTTTLAGMASPKADGTASVDDGGGAGPGCNTAAEIAGENADGDFFFCTPTASQLEPIFQTAASQVSGGIRLLRLP